MRLAALRFRDRGARAGCAHLSRERGEIVGAVVPTPVDEERRRARYAAQIGGVHVLGDVRRTRASAKVVLEALDVEPELLSVAVRSESSSAS